MGGGALDETLVSEVSVLAIVLKLERLVKLDSDSEL